MITTENYEAYLLMREEGELSAEKAKELKEFLSKNPDLAPQKNEYDPKIKAIYSIDEPFALTKELLHTPSAKFYLWKPLSFAASLALVIAISILIFKNSNNKTPQFAKKSQKQTNLSTKVAEPIAKANTTNLKTNIFYANSSNQKRIAQKTTYKTTSQKQITAQQPTQPLSPIAQTNIEQSKTKQDRMQTDQPKEQSQKSISIRVNTLVVYAQPNTEKQDTVHIYTNSLCTFSSKRQRNKIRFIVPESITNLIAKL